MTCTSHPIPITQAKAATQAKGIHNGLNTHHQDQSITLHNFNVINTMVSNPTKVMPPDDSEDLLLIIIYFRYSVVEKWGLEPHTITYNLLSIQFQNPSGYFSINLSYFHKPLRKSNNKMKLNSTNTKRHISPNMTVILKNNLLTLNLLTKTQNTCLIHSSYVVAHAVSLRPTPYSAWWA